MTPEEKAEEYLRKGICQGCTFICEATCAYAKPVKQGYLDGLTEGKPKWHDLREDPTDLPKENGEYWCKWNDGAYCTEHYFQDYGFGDYVIAWCELPRFEE